MGNFSISNKLTGGNEGGYADNPNDKGGETIYGISRKNWSKWPGWNIVDKYKIEANGDIHLLNRLCNADSGLQSLKLTFYKTNFWDVNKLDQINDQRICDTVYDFGVNSGTGKAAKFLQRAIGITEDGIIGPGTLSAVNAVLIPRNIYAKFNALRKQFYTDLAKEPGQEEFLHSWLSRLTDY